MTVQMSGKDLHNRSELFYSTGLGQAHWGDTLSLLPGIPDKSIDLILTSPPFALKRKKEYGNEDEDKYVEWFMEFARHFHRILSPNGSFVLDLGGAYLPGFPVRTIYQFELCVRPLRQIDSTNVNPAHFAGRIPQCAVPCNSA